MLMLNRRIGHTVCVGEDIEVMVTGVAKDANGDYVVELGFDAPRRISIDRKEVRERRAASVGLVVNAVNPENP